MNATLKLHAVPTRRPAPAPLRAQASARTLAHRRWFASNPQLLTKLYVAHRARVQSLLVRSGVAAGEVEDLCADVFVIAMRRLHTFEGASSPSTWLCGIARKVAADHRRSARVRREVTCDETPDAPVFDGPFEQVAHQEQAQQVRAAVQSLKPGPRAVVQQFVLNERPMDQVARSQRVPLQTAYARLYAGQNALRKVLSA
jgi:RNA polymerase sigma-70 factor (ECF subfamily)